MKGLKKIFRNLGMKKGCFASFVLLAGFVFLLSPAVSAQTTIVIPDQATVSWDAVTTDVNGDPITGATYQVFLLAEGADRTNEANWQLVAETDQTRATLTFQVPNTYVVGVRSVYNGLESAVNWSDVNGASTPEPFVVLFAHPPSMPIGLRPD